MREEVMIKLIDIAKSYGDVEAVKGISLDIYPGEFVTFLGPSGCGKTTTLRMIGGFEEPDRGDVLIEGRSVKGKKPYEIDVNTVFQSYALFPHMSVFNNVAFGLKMKKVKDKELQTKVEEALTLVKMDQYANRLPKQLSGGEQQRIAVARAIVNNPRVLLLDEPLGALDLKLRKQMQIELKQLQKKLKMTFIYVTHDQEEALVMSDRVVVMNAGRIEQVDTPTDVYRYPKSRFVADFIGETNLLKCSVAKIKGSYIFLNRAQTIFKASADLAVGAEIGREGFLSIRPEDIKVYETDPAVQAESANGKSAGINIVQATVEDVIFIGSTAKLITRTITPEAYTLIVYSPLAVGSALVGKKVFLSWKPEQAIFITE